MKKGRPDTPAYPVVSDAIKTLFEEVGIGGKDVEASAKEAVEKINTRLERNKAAIRNSSSYATRGYF
ncbi:hypothetical protein [Halalkalibacter flavus]|uniref:hypothetical protein n=1 Tax=Halalkalibacter flavus TaxID=3090668 RepID=UPI002FC86293